MTQLLVIAIVLFGPLSDDLGIEVWRAGGWLWGVQIGVPVFYWLIAGRLLKRPRGARAVRLMRFGAVIWHGLMVYGLGWAEEIRSLIGRPVLLDELIIALPGLAMVSVGRAFGERLRLELLPVVVPIFILQTWAELAEILWGQSISVGWLAALQLGGVVVLIAFMPELLRRVWRTEPLPAGPVRTSLQVSLDHAGVRARDLLLWKTGGRVGNAAVMGIVPQVRYIMITDVLVRTLEPDELAGVAAHEVGHVKHRHLIWLVLSVAAVLSLAWLLADTIRLPRPWAEVVVLGSILAGLFFGFGLVSRIFERQADAFAVKQLSSLWGEPRITGRAIDVFCSALTQVSLMGSVPRTRWTWRHGSIAGRQRRLGRLADSPFDRVPVDRWAMVARFVILLSILGPILVDWVAR